MMGRVFARASREGMALQAADPVASVRRRPRRAIVALAGSGRANGRSAEALAQSLAELGIETTCLGREDDPSRIAAAVVRVQADAVELCLTGTCGVAMLRDLLRELVEIGRRDVSIVVHRGD